MPTQLGGYQNSKFEADFVIQYMDVFTTLIHDNRGYLKGRID